MWHVSESLSLDKLEEAFNGQAMNVGIIHMVKIRNEFSSGCDDRLLK